MIDSIRNKADERAAYQQCNQWPLPHSFSQQKLKFAAICYYIFHSERHIEQCIALTTKCPTHTFLLSYAGSLWLRLFVVLMFHFLFLYYKVSKPTTENFVIVVVAAATINAPLRLYKACLSISKRTCFFLLYALFLFLQGLTASAFGCHSASATAVS